MRALMIALGQSNWAGAARNEGGGVPLRYRSIATGITDPLPMCGNANQGGSCFPLLIDIMYARGVRLDVFNAAIGGASIWDYCGRVGGTPPVSGATIIGQGYFLNGQRLSGGTGTCVEGDPDFDPFGLLAWARTALASASALDYDIVVSYWCNGESDAGSTAGSYADAQVSVANYMLGSAVDKHLIGLTCKQAAATAESFNILQQGITQAVAALKYQDKPVFRGHDMYARYGSAPPLYPEPDGVSYVHLTMRGQEVQAHLASNALYAAGV